MRTLLFLLLVLPTALAAQSDEAVLRHFKTVLWPKAYATQNVALLDSLLDARYAVIDGIGEITTKAAALSRVRASKPSWSRLEFNITRIEVYGTTALIVGQGIMSGDDGSGGTWRKTYWSSNWFEKRDGRWRALASHTSLPQSVK